MFRVIASVTIVRDSFVADTEWAAEGRTEEKWDPIIWSAVPDKT